MIDELQFEKLDTIDAVIRQRCTEITHITVHEVVDRNGYPQLGRICFGAVDLGAFVEPEDDDRDDPNDDRDDSNDDNDRDDPNDDPLGDLARMDNGVTYAVLADAAIRWIKHMADQNMLGQREGKFKVNLWKGKGDKVIYSSRFICTNTEYEEPAVAVPAPTVPLPPLSPDTSPDPAPAPNRMVVGSIYCTPTLNSSSGFHDRGSGRAISSGPATLDAGSGVDNQMF